MLTLLLCALPLWAPCPQDPAEQFIREFGMAMRVNDTRAQDLTLRRNRRVALDYFLGYMISIRGPQDLWVVAFGEAWKRLYRSDFPILYITQISNMSREAKKVRTQATGPDLGAVNLLYVAAVKSRSPEDWASFREAGISLEETLRQIEDYYYQAVILKMIGDSHFSEFQKGPGDPEKAFEFWGKFLEIRKKLDYDNDLEYSKAHRDREGLRYDLGLAPESTGPKVAVSPFQIPAAEGENWHRLELQFSAESKFDAVRHPSDKSSTTVTNWFVTSTQGIGSEGVFPLHCQDKDCFMNNQKFPIKLKRDKLNLFHIEAGGTPSEPFALKRKPTLVTFEQTFPDGPTKMHAFWVATGSDKGNLNGIQLNQGMLEHGGLMYLRPASMMTAKSPWGEFRYYEDNYDSVFGKLEPSVAAMVGMPPTVFLKRFDSISLGRTKYSRPASRYFPNDKGDWFELQCPENVSPTFVKIRKVQPTLGLLQVVAKGYKEVKLATLILKSLTSETKDTYIEVGAVRQPAKLPIGRYELVQGYLRGKDGQSALILPPSDGPIILTIDADEVESLEIGSPFKLHGTFGVEDEEIILHGNRIHVYGKSGERYLVLNEAPLNQLLIQVKGGQKGQTEPAAPEVVEKDWNAAFFPAPLRLPLPKRGEPMIKISLKKHPWFGKLSSDWIE